METIKNTFSISTIPVPNDMDFVFFGLKSHDLVDTSEIFSFVTQRLATSQELSAVLFQKENYCISLSVNSRGWTLFKASGLENFANFSEGMVAAYEMGFKISVLFYSPSLFFSSPVASNSLFLESLVKTLTNAYSQPPSHNTYLKLK